MVDNSRQYAQNESTFLDDRSFCQMVSGFKGSAGFAGSYKNTDEEIINTETEDLQKQNSRVFDGSVKSTQKQHNLKKITSMKVTPINDDGEIAALEEMIYNEKVQLTKQEMYDLENIVKADMLMEQASTKTKKPNRINAQNLDQQDAQKSMIDSIIQITLESYNVNKNLSTEYVISILDSQQLQMLKENLEQQLLSTFQQRQNSLLHRQDSKEKLNNSLSFDLGHYPLTPWLNKENNPNQTNMRIEEVKNLAFFLPPKPREDLFVLRYGECSSFFELDQYIKNSPLLVNSGMSSDEFENSVQRINSSIRPYKQRSSFYEKLIILYLLIGLLVVGTLTIVLGILISFIISIIMAIIYFSGFIYLIIKVRRITNELLIKVHFNLSLALRNENDKVYSRYGIKARPGYLSKWIEYHWANPYAPALP